MIIHDFKFINKKKIALFGCGLEGEKVFYYLRERSYKIEKVFDNHKVGFFHGLEIEQLPSDKRIRDYFYLITSAIYYKEIKEQLEAKGLKEYTDFAFSYEGIKKIVIINANCYGLIISEYLRSSTTFNEMYHIHQIPPIYENTDGKISDEILRQCDLFIHQDIREDNGYGEKLGDTYIRKQLKDTCIDITIPNLVGMGSVFYPYMERRDKKQAPLEMYFPFMDKRIDELCRQGKNPSRIVQEISNVTTANIAYIRDNLDKTVKKFKKREEKWDIKIMDYILHNYQKHQLFYDPYHPVNEILEIIANGILKLLGIKEEKIVADQNLGATEYFLYSDVKVALNLEYDISEIRKNSFFKLMPKMDLEEYVKEYLFLANSESMGK